MERVMGTFRREGQVVAEKADIFLQVDVGGPCLLWYGSFELPPGAEMGDAGVYHLELVDGRHGDVTVSRPTVRSGYRYGGFTGRGPLLGSAT